MWFRSLKSGGGGGRVNFPALLSSELAHPSLLAPLRPAPFHSPGERVGLSPLTTKVAREEREGHHSCSRATSLQMSGRASSPIFLPSRLAHPHPFTRASYTVLPGWGTGLVFLSVAASEMEGQFSRAPQPVCVLGLGKGTFAQPWDIHVVPSSCTDYRHPHVLQQ